MNDPWTEKLSDHIDGFLTETENRDLLQHLAGCAECRTILAELREVLAATHAAPLIEPARDLWPGIQARIAAGVVTPIATADLAELRPIAAAARRGRRFSFSMPELAAAAIVLMTLSGTAVWLVGRTPAAPVTSGTIVQSASGGGSVRTIAELAPLPDFSSDIADLEAALEQNRARLDPATVEVIERSLESIDRAIADARAALDADPGNPYLHRQLDSTMRKKVDILRRATRV